MKIIDPHIHLFNLKQGDYHWLKANNPPFWPDKSLINKTFSEDDLALDPPLELTRFVHIEAGFNNNRPWRELAFLEAVSSKQTGSKPFRAIAAIDLTESNQEFTKALAKLTELKSCVGVRHILDEQALSLLTNKQVLSNIKVLNDFAKDNNQGLVFEVQLPLSTHAAANALCEVISDNSDISFIINHAGFPPADIDTLDWQRWQSNLLKLSAYLHVAIKCSGWEMTDRSYQQDWLNKNLTLIVNIFGANRMMLASNFPLCLLSKNSYQAYWQSLLNSDFFQALSEQEKSALCYNNALKWYQLSEAESLFNGDMR